VCVCVCVCVCVAGGHFMTTEYQELKFRVGDVPGILWASLVENSGG
jgi:hypothetical protein